jgi:uncharacterized protein YaaN involved in tellurite resistance
MDTEAQLERIERRLDTLEKEVGLAVNYMRVLAEIMGCRAKLEEIDRELRDTERRDTDPAPDMNGDTQP